jgi:nicotinamide mononucleotide transporter
VFVVIGFVVWARASRTVVDTTDPDRTTETVSA